MHALRSPGPRFAHVVFDFDGTLVDSAGDIVGCLEEAVREAGLALDGPIPTSVVGPPLTDLVARLFPRTTVAAREALIERFKALYDASSYPRTRPYPGVRALLADLRASGVATYIATNKRSAPTLRLVDWLELGPFRGVACIDGVPGPPRSKTEMLKALALAHALPPERTALVGDTEGDVRAAHACGVTAIAVLHGYGDERQVRAAAPHHIGEDTAALRRLLVAPYDEPTGRNP